MKSFRKGAERMPRTQRGAALAAVAAAAGLASAQVEIYSNASAVDPREAGLSTGPLTSSGVPALGTDSWSELQVEGGYANAVAGYSSHLTEGGEGYRFADDFTVTGDQGWRLDSVALFAYQIGATAAFPPIASANVRIWDGPPGEAGSSVIHGDASTDRLRRLITTGVYRVFATITPPAPLPPERERLIWQVEVDLGGVTLPPGTYWIDWQYTAALEGAEIFTPAITLERTRSLPGWNGRQHNPVEETWTGVIDGGKPSAGPDVPLDLPFILIGWSSCMADLTGDGRVDFTDYLEFLNLYDSGDPAADLNADGYVDFADYLVFLNLYEAGC